MNRFHAMGHALVLGGVAACGEVPLAADPLADLHRQQPQIQGAMEEGCPDGLQNLSAESYARAHHAVRELFANSAASQSYPGIQARGAVGAPINLEQTPIDLEAGTYLSGTLTATLLGDYCDEEGGVASSFLLTGPATLGDEQGTLSLRMSGRPVFPSLRDEADAADVTSVDLLMLEIVEEAFLGDVSPKEEGEADETDETGAASAPETTTAAGDGSPEQGSALEGNNLIATGGVDTPALAANDTLAAADIDTPALAANDTLAAADIDTPAPEGDESVSTHVADAPAATTETFDPKPQALAEEEPADTGLETLSLKSASSPQTGAPSAIEDSGPPAPAAAPTPTGGATDTRNPSLSDGQQF